MMSHNGAFSASNLHGAHAASSQEPMIDLLEIFRLVRSRWTLIVGVAALAVVAGLLYLVIAPARYTATASLLIDAHQAPSLQPQSSAGQLIDSAYVDSQVEVLKSDGIARSVIKKLDLLRDPEFEPDSSRLGRLRASLHALFVRGSAPDETHDMTRAVDAFQKRLTIKRIGLTYVIQIDYRSLDPNTAARISNAVTDAYLESQLESKYQAARHASDWLRERIDELKTQAQAAELAAAQFKAKNNFQDSGTQSLSEQQLANLSSQRATALKDLNSSAQIRRSLYETLLQRSTEMIQQQSFPRAEARVIAEASPPLEKSDPKALLVLGGSATLGLVGGLAAAFAREHLSTVFVNGSQLEKDAGISCVGILPRLPDRSTRIKPRQPDSTTAAADSEHPLVPRDSTVHRRFLLHDPARYTFVIDRPFSPCNEVIRFLAADFSAGSLRNKVVGVTSALPREGKSMVAASLSEMLADAGRKVLLIDCDLRNSGLTRLLAPEATAGLIDAVAGRTALQDLTWSDPITKLDFLPSVGPFMRNAHPSAILSCTAMQQLLDSVQDRYEHVILDLPAILPVADVKAASPLIAAFILVIEWGRTSRASVAEALGVAPLVADKLVGGVLNKAVLKEVKRHVSEKRQHYPFPV